MERRRGQSRIPKKMTIEQPNESAAQIVVAHGVYFCSMMTSSALMTQLPCAAADVSTLRAI